MNETVLNNFLRDGKNGLSEEFNVLSLFDGMSCGQIALNNIGLKPTRYYAAEIKKHAIQCTMDNFPDTIQIGDVTKVKGQDLPKIHLLIGGSPCQDFSRANSVRDGLKGMKSMLFYEYIRLLEETKPDYYLLENVIMDANGVVDFEDTSITQNTRVSYPIYHIENIQVPSIGKNPKNIFFLTADAFGVLPPISKLTPGQAAYHFISGYTAKVAGTEAGIDEPLPSFSACFGAPFMPLHPTKYAEMLSQKMKEAGVNVWLVNTGWTGGPYGIGTRMKLKYTRAMITAALEGKLDNVRFESLPIFNLSIPTECEGVPSEILNPVKTWSNKDEYESTSKKLALEFIRNFEQFKSKKSDDILKAGPVLLNTFSE